MWLFMSGLDSHLRALRQEVSGFLGASTVAYSLMYYIFDREHPLFLCGNINLSTDEVKRFLFRQGTRPLERKARTAWALEFERRWSE